MKMGIGALEVWENRRNKEEDSSISQTVSALIGIKLKGKFVLQNDIYVLASTINIWRAVANFYSYCNLKK